MSNRRKGEAPKQHKVIRNFVKNNEFEALIQVCKKTNLQPKNFTKEHTNKLFVFTEK